MRVRRESIFEIAPILKAALADVGIVAQDAEIYTLLLKKGPQRAKYITKFTGTNKALVYRSLKCLQAKGVVTSRLGFPASFEATPLNVILDQAAECRRREAQAIIRNKKLLYDALRLLEVAETPTVEDKFAILKNVHIAAMKGIELAKRTINEYLLMNDLLLSHLNDYFKDLVSVATTTVRHKAQFRLITHVDCMHLDEAKKIVARLDMNSRYIEIRHLELSPLLFPRFALSDENALILNFDSWQEQSEQKLKPEKLIWTTNKTLIRLMRLLFNEEWNKSIDMRKRIAELENNKNPFQASENIESFIQNAVDKGSYSCRKWDPKLWE
jgi:sugar-specific transcriptional regulator TrmB